MINETLVPPNCISETLISLPCVFQHIHDTGVPPRCVFLRIHETLVPPRCEFLKVFSLVALGILSQQWYLTSLLFCYCNLISQNPYHNTEGKHTDVQFPSSAGLRYGLLGLQFRGLDQLEGGPREKM